MNEAYGLLPDMPLLPKKAAEERPLLIILGIMACLASLTLILSLAGFRTSHTWQSDNARALTIQIMPSEAGDIDGEINEAMRVLISVLPGARIEAINGAAAKKLLKPWIGDIDLPEDLPLPILLKVETVSDVKTDIDMLKRAFSSANLETIIDDHSRWRENIRKTWQTVQTGMWGIIMLVMTASAAIICYATRSVLRSRQRIINVLSHVGASDRFIVTLFTRRFFALGCKAGIAGAVTALLAVIIFSLRTKTLASGVLPHTGLYLTDLLWLGALIVGFALLSGITAIITTRALIASDRQY